MEDPEQYITRVGKFIRKTGIDELPQIYQVFTSELSMVVDGCIINTTEKSIDFSGVVTV